MCQLSAKVTQRIPGGQSHQSQLGAVRSHWVGLRCPSSSLEGSLQTFTVLWYQHFSWTWISPFLAIFSLEKSPRIFDVLDSGGFWRVWLDQHAHVPHHLKIQSINNEELGKTKIWGSLKNTSATLRPEVKDLRQGSSSFFTFIRLIRLYKQGNKFHDKLCRLER